jgi:hypothetical protein
MQHITNAHPKVRCCGTLLNESDLDMHYLTSRNHPVCDRCNVGFPSEQEYGEVGGQCQWFMNAQMIVCLNIAQFRTTLGTAVQDLRGAVSLSGGIKCPCGQPVEPSPVRIL